jgi:peptidoglycan/LPS O-acetylase OafA/YrhL
MKQARLSNIEMLRGLASLAVAWFHLTNTHSPGLIQQSGSYGWLGVDCFFVLSGFIIPYSLNAAGYTVSGFPRFMGRRLIRLEPPYVASMVLVIALAFVSQMFPAFHGGAPHFTVPQLASHLLYMAPFFHQEWINTVYWSLTFEFVFYIACGLLFPLLFKRGLWWTALLVAGAAVAVHTKALLEPRVILFLIGIAAMRYFVGRDRLPVFLICVLGSAALMAAVDAIPGAIVGAATALVLTLVKAPEIRPLTALGAISYSLYLLHVPIGGRIVNLGQRFGHGTLFDLTLSLAALAASLAAAFVFYRLIEAPATALARRLSLNVGKPAPAETAPEASTA